MHRDLPYVHESDENQVVERAANIASTGDLNPHWFGAPGSTLIYPLALLYRAGTLASHVEIPSATAAHVSENPVPDGWAWLYVTGRLVTVLFAVATVPAVFLLARSLFDDTVALLAAGLAPITPVVIWHAQIVRTDSPATFFCVVALYRTVRVVGDPGWKNQLLAGGCIGLGVASRYFVVALVPVLLSANALACGRTHALSSLRGSERFASGAIIGLAAACIAFAVAAPFAILDLPATVESLKVEARGAALGADGLSRPENFLWYTATAIPGAIGWPQWLAALTCVGLILRHPHRVQVLLPLAVAAFLFGISLSQLHWQRWTIPILPLVSVMGAHGIASAARASSVNRWRRVLIGVMSLAVVAAPLWGALTEGLGYTSRSTRLLARDWITGNVPEGSRIAAEWYTAPLPAGRFDARFIYALGSHRLAYYRAAGTEYAVVSSAQYDRFISEPERYPAAVRFYNQLFDSEEMVAEFVPSLTRAGPTIRVYRLAR